MRKFLVIISFTFLSQLAYSQTFTLTISIPNINSREGEIQIGIYNKKDDFPKVDKQYRVLLFKADNFQGVCSVKDLPKGEYAIAIMHDKNTDKICNTNFFGIPTEGYGFSRNYRPKLSAPTFDDCKIDVNRNLSITIDMIY